MQENLGLLITESNNPDTREIGSADSLTIVKLINAEDKKVAGCVEQELPQVAKAIDLVSERLKKGGRACILTFHSLEDRIVKNVFRSMSEGCTCPKSFPVCVCGKKEEIELVNRKPITASEEEQKSNSRSTSAKLRIARKLE